MAPTMSELEVSALSPCITYYTPMLSQSLPTSQMQERNLLSLRAASTIQSDSCQFLQVVRL